MKMHKNISHISGLGTNKDGINKECLAYLLRVGEELYTCILADTQFRISFSDYNRRMWMLVSAPTTTWSTRQCQRLA